MELKYSAVPIHRKQIIWQVWEALAIKADVTRADIISVNRDWVMNKVALIIPDDLVEEIIN